MKRVFRKRLIWIPLACVLSLGIGLSSAALAGAFSSGDSGVSPTSLTENWIDYTSSFSGSGTQSNPYKIASAQNLAYLALKVNSGTTYSGKYFEQTADIRLGGREWTPIGNSSYQFQGNFNGKHHEINGLYINNTGNNQGLFGCTTNATIENIYLKNTNINAWSYVGGIVGNAMANTEVVNCVNNGKISGGGQIAGIMGCSATEANVTNCKNYGEVIGSGVYGIAGIVGLANGGRQTNCENHATIKGADSTSWVGGIIGDNYGQRISNCINYGDIYGGNGVGGVIGITARPMSNCANFGNVYAAQEAAGGITGGIAYAVVTNCYSTGKVTLEGSENSIGTLVGKNYDTSNSRIFKNCFFIGSTNKDTNFVGVDASYVEFENCYAKFNNKKIYSSGDFSDFILLPGQNNDFPIQKVYVSSLYHNNTITSNWFKTNGFTKI